MHTYYIHGNMYLGQHAWAYMCVFMYTSTHTTDTIYECVYIDVYICRHI